MKKATTLVLIIVLLLQMCNGFLENSTDSDCVDMEACEIQDEEEGGKRTSREEVQENHTDARGPYRSATSSASMPAEQDGFGGSWFDDIDDGAGIESLENIILEDGDVLLSSYPYEQWNRTYGGGDYELGSSLAQTADGGYIITGFTESLGPRVGWLVKTDAMGNELWNKTFDGSYEGKSVIEDTNGDYVVVGQINVGGGNGFDVWLMKTDNQGDQIWEKTYGGSNVDVGNSLQQTNDGGYVIVGYGYGDILLLKTDASGIKQWDKTFGGDELDMGESVIQTSDGGYVIVGSIPYGGTGHNNVSVIKTDASGNKQWDKVFGGKVTCDRGSSVMECSDGGYIVTGYTQQYGGNNLWLIRIDSSGNEIWNKTFNGGSSASVYSILGSSYGGYLIAGGTDSYGSGSMDVWLIKTDSFGNELWNDTIGGSNYDVFHCLVETSDGRYALVGQTNSYGSDNYDAWLIKCKDQFYNRGYMKSITIELSDNMDWSSLSISKTEPANTYINVSVINNATNQTIPGFDNITKRTIDLSDLNDLNITSIRLKAYFSGNGSATPSLTSWGVEWTSENAWRDSFIGREKSYDINEFSPDTNTIGLWHFNEGFGSDTIDASGNGHHGTLINMSEDSWINGRYDTGLTFDGNDDVVDVGYLHELENANQLTISCWIRPEIRYSKRIISHGTFATGNGCLLQILTNKLTFHMKHNYHQSYFISDNLPAMNEWTMISFTYDAFKGLGQFYINGDILSLQESHAWGGDFPIIPVPDVKKTVLGGGDGDWFKGGMDEVYISKVALSYEEIQQAYQGSIAIRGGQVQLLEYDFNPSEGCVGYWNFDSGHGNTAYDISGNGNNGTLINMNDNDWIEGVIGKALEFDGENDFIEIPDSASLKPDNISVELWIKPFEQRIQKILTKGITYNIYYRLDLGGLRVEFFTDGGGGNCYGGGLPLNVWSHVAITFDGMIGRLYINGEGKNTLDVPDGTLDYTRQGGSDSLYISGFDQQFYKGALDEIKIYNRALTNNEINLHSKMKQIHHHKATLRSESIILPENGDWGTFHCNRTVPDNTHLNISVHDATTNETLLWDYSRNGDVTLNISGIDKNDHPSIYFQAYFQSNRTETPILYDWAVNWTTSDEVVSHSPELFEEIRNVTFFEDTEAPNKVNLSDHFQDINEPLSPLSFSILNTDGSYINKTINGTMVSFWSDTKNWSGTETFKVNCTNALNMSIESNLFNVTVLPVDDRPMWKHHIQDIVLIEDNSSESINLMELVEDAENDTIGFSYNVNETNIMVNITQGNMVITPSDNWFGNTTMEITVYQASNETLNSTTNFNVKVTSKNDLPITDLLFPENGSTFNTREITLYWSGFDVESPLDALRYDIYILTDLTRGITGKEPTHSNIEGTTLAVTLDYGTYYWTVIGFDGEDYGICADGYFTFNITNITIPEIELLSPASYSIVTTTNVTLEWIGIDTPGITYVLYLGNSSDELRKIAEINGTSYLMNDLEDYRTYFWKVCAKMNNITGTCASGVRRFHINTSWVHIYNITVEVTIDMGVVQQGSNGAFWIRITNVGNADVTIQFTGKGVLKNMLFLPENFTLSDGAMREVCVTLTGTSTLALGTYNAEIIVSFHGKTKTITVPLKVVAKPGPDTEKGEDEGMSDLTKGLIIGSIILLLIVIIVLFLVFRKRKKEDEYEEEETEPIAPVMEVIKGDGEEQDPFQQPPAEQPMTWQSAPQQPPDQVPYQQPVAEAAPTYEEPVEPIPPIPEEPEEEYESVPPEEVAAPADVTPPLDDIFGVPEKPPEEPVPREPAETAPPPVEELKITTYKDFIAETPPEPISSNVIRLIPNYNITHKLGAGGFGTVYKAMHISGRYVAIKLPKMLGETVDMNILNKFKEEAEIWRKLNHTNIVEFIEGEIRPVPYLAIELMEGGNLKQLVSKYQLNIGEAVYIMAQVLDGMSFAHRMATIHRDLKPENILFTKDGIPKISDWGIGKFMGSMSTEKTMGMKGTMLYSAPEQISKLKFGPVDWATDIFQLGIVFYEMITRRHPFYDEDPVGIIGKITGEDPIPPSEINSMIPKELDNIIMTALQKDKAKRWRSADIMHHELKRLVEG